jgi:hypothetical protein
MLEMVGFDQLVVLVMILPEYLSSGKVELPRNARGGLLRLRLATEVVKRGNFKRGRGARKGFGLEKAAPLFAMPNIPIR